MKTVLFIVMIFTWPLAFSQNKVTVVIHSKEGYDGFETFADQSAALLEKVLNSNEFKNEIMKAKFTETNGMTNEQIYNAIMTAHETSGPGGTDHVVDLRVRTVNKEQDGRRWMKRCKPGSETGTIGIDGGNSGITAVCPQWLKIWFDDKDYASLASHYGHEYMHIIGFTHHHVKATSVPYVVDSIIYNLIHNKTIK